MAGWEVEWCLGGLRKFFEGIGIELLDVRRMGVML